MKKENTDTGMTRVRITARWTGAELYAFDAPADTPSGVAFGSALESAVRDGADLGGADLRGANLYGANLRGANLRGADLGRADLGGANLHGAYLAGANLADANLRGADLHGAALRGADLGGADLHGADLTSANLGGADLHGATLHGAALRGANLAGANLADNQLTAFRDDVWAVLSAAPKEARSVLDALRNGIVDGSTYSGDCACLVGTIAKTRGCSIEGLGALEPNSSRLAETWFAQIEPGDTPGTHRPTALATEWVSQWIESMQAAFGEPAKMGEA